MDSGDGNSTTVLLTQLFSTHSESEQKKILGRVASLEQLGHITKQCINLLTALFKCVIDMVQKFSRHKQLLRTHGYYWAEPDTSDDQADGSVHGLLLPLVVDDEDENVVLEPRTPPPSPKKKRKRKEPVPPSPSSPPHVIKEPESQPPDQLP